MHMQQQISVEEVISIPFNLNGETAAFSFHVQLKRAAWDFSKAKERKLLATWALLASIARTEKEIDFK